MYYNKIVKWCLQFNPADRPHFRNICDLLEKSEIRDSTDVAADDDDAPPV